jgi:Zn-dependent protease with chaperone function
MHSSPRTDWEGTYFDGRVAERHTVTVTLTAASLRIEWADGRTILWSYGEVRQVQGARPGEPARLERGGDEPEVLVVDDPDFLGAIRDVAPHYRNRFTDASRRRARTRAVVAGVAAAVAAAGVLYGWIIPLLAARVAARLPVTWEESLGRRVMVEIVDSTAICPNPAALDRLVGRLAAGADGRYAFRVTVVGDSIVNAFAAPGGYVVVYRGLLELAETPEELAGVLAHEMQHVLLQHGTQAVLREIPLRLMVAAVTADAGLAGHVAGAAATLGSLRYGRQAEEEADREGMRMLQRARVDPRGMVTFFGRLQERVGDVPRVAAYLSTHPRTEARIARLEGLAAAATYAAEPLIDAEAWEGVRRACAASGPVEPRFRL